MKKKIKILFGVLLGFTVLAGIGTGWFYYQKFWTEQNQQNTRAKEELEKINKKIEIENNKFNFLYELNSSFFESGTGKNFFQEKTVNFEKLFLENKITQEIYFYQQSYAKLLNKDLKNFYFNWGQKILDSWKKIFMEKIILQLEDLNFLIRNYFKEKLGEQFDLKISQTNEVDDNFLVNFSTNVENVWQDNLKNYNQMYQDFFQSINDLSNFEEIKNNFLNWKKDAWIVFDQKDAVDVSDFQHMVGPQNESRYELYSLLKKIISVEKNKRFSIYEEKNWVPELNKKNIQLTNVLKKVLPTLISRKWDFEKQVKVLFRFLAFKNEYYGYQKDPNESTDEWYLKDAKQVDFSGVLGENKTHMDCKGYSLFMYGALQALGYQNIGFESMYKEDDGKYRVPHVNVWVVVDGIKYVVDATYADQFHNDWGYEEWQWIDSYFLTEKEYLEKNHYQIGESLGRFFNEYYQDPNLL